MYITNRKHRQSWRFPWHILFSLFVILGIVLYSVAILTGAYRVPSTTIGKYSLIVCHIFFWMSGIVAVFSGLLLLYEAVESLKNNGEKLDNTVEMLSRQNNLLLQVSQATRLSDTAKKIVFRSDRAGNNDIWIYNLW